MTVDLDTLLTDDLLSVPEEFSQRVMRDIYAQPVVLKRETARADRLRWLALLAAAGLGLSQLLAFMFGMWATSSAL